MKRDILKEIGLSDHQVAAYSYLLKNGPAPPPVIARKLKLTRSNAYKVLDQLLELGLVSRLDMNKKLHYKAEDPIALASIAAEERNRVIALEQNIKEGMQQLRQTYQKSNGPSEVQSYQGATAVKSLYEHQAKIGQPIYFIKTRADIPTLGFEAMDYIRKQPRKYGATRHGITPDSIEGPASSMIDGKSNLTRTWMPQEAYTAPIEWTVSGEELMIINFNDKPSGIRIKNKVVAEAFKQLWLLLDENLRKNPEYKKMPKKAKRMV